MYCSVHSSRTEINNSTNTALLTFMTQVYFSCVTPSGDDKCARNSSATVGNRTMWQLSDLPGVEVVNGTRFMTQ